MSFRRVLSIRTRTRLLALLLAVALAGAGVWWFAIRGDSEGGGSGGAPLDVAAMPARSEVSVEVEAVSPTAGDSSFSGSFVVDTVSLRASGELDMSSIANDSGIFGDYETIPTAWDGYQGLFDVITPEGEWLSLDLESASPRKGADIAWLREAMLCNPNLALSLAQAVPDGSLEPTEVDLRDFFSGTSPQADTVAVVLAESWAVGKATVALGAGSGEFSTSFSYPVVPSSPDDVEVNCRFTVVPVDDEPELPAESELITYEELSS